MAKKAKKMLHARKLMKKLDKERADLKRDRFPNDRLCSVKGCLGKSRTKGWCAAHYEKRRRLEASKRLPASWKDFAKPGTVKDVHVRKAA